MELKPEKNCPTRIPYPVKLPFHNEDKLRQFQIKAENISLPDPYYKDCYRKFSRLKENKTRW